MQQNKISILSTRPLNDSWVAEAKAAGIAIDALSFIVTEPIRSIQVQQEIENAFLRSATVVFTSMNAAEAVITELDDQQPDWTIYCTGNTTRQLVKKYFSENSLAGTANSAAELGEMITKENNTDEIIFFCGDQRRDELPEMLRSKNIDVHEIVVYQTIATPHKIENVYDGILFFSPSAVESFFAKMFLHGMLFRALGQQKMSQNKRLLL